MKNLPLITLLMISALFGSVRGVVASNHLPLCKGSPTSDPEIKKTWSGCFGRFFNDSFLIELAGDYWEGEWENGQFHGQGTYVKFTPWND